MKKLLIIILLSIPFYSRSQENWLGKNRCDINIAFQDAKTPRVANAVFPGDKLSDTFANGKNEETICNYDNMEICTEVIKIEKASYLNSAIKDFDDKYTKANGELMLKNSWVDKAGTFKVHLENWTGINKLFLIYVPFEKQFVRK